jgi:hypothetical protein
MGQQSIDLQNTVTNSFTNMTGTQTDLESIQQSALQLAAILELRRQNILLEQQNLLIENQTHAIWVETCYAPRTANMGYQNYTAWNQECTNAGYPAGSG